MKTILRLALLLLAFQITDIETYGQVDPQVSQFWMQMPIYNPSSIQQNNQINLFAYARQQWSGFENAPSTQYFGITNYFENLKVGLGLSILNDNIGVENAQNIKLNYTYNVWINKEINLVFGAGMGILHRKINTANLVFENSNDPHMHPAEDNKTVFDADFGMEVSYKQIHGGVSVLHLLKSNEASTNFNTPRHYYIYGSYLLVVTDKISIQPGLAFKKSGNIFQTGITALMSYEDIFAFGMTYRINDAYSFMAKLAIFHQIYLGYAFDLDAGKVRSYNSGSHEISIMAKINKSGPVLKSPRFFD